MKTRCTAALLAWSCLLLLGACALEEGASLLSGADDSRAEVSPQLQAKVRNGALLETTEDTNLRDGPSQRSRVLRVVPRGSQVHIVGTSQAFLGFFSVSHDGVQGWMNGAYLRFVAAEKITIPDGWVVPSGVDLPAKVDPSEETPDLPGDEGNGQAIDLSLPPPSRADAIARAKTGVGFSYWWGGGAWDPSGATRANAGICTGVCPSCEHEGNYGADCSGFISKVWQVPAGNVDLRSNMHGYTTAAYMRRSDGWDTVDRGALEAGDALVHNENGSGHIVLYESGDAWGSFWTYESRGCAAGIVHNLRAVPATWRAIRRHGY